MKVPMFSLYLNYLALQNTCSLIFLIRKPNVQEANYLPCIIEILGYSQNWNQEAFPSPLTFSLQWTVAICPYISTTPVRPAIWTNLPRKQQFHNSSEYIRVPLTNAFYSHRPPSPNIHRFFSQV